MPLGFTNSIKMMMMKETLRSWYQSWYKCCFTCEKITATYLFKVAPISRFFTVSSDYVIKGSIGTPIQRQP